MTKVTDEQVGAACVAYDAHWSNCEDHKSAMRAALEAALSIQGKVVGVEKLEALADSWVNGGWRTGADYVNALQECADQLRALIGEDHG